MEMSRGKKTNGEDCNAYQLAARDHWPLQVVVGITSKARKSVGSTEGMLSSAKTSPFYKSWVDTCESSCLALVDTVWSFVET